MVDSIKEWFKNHKEKNQKYKKQMLEEKSNEMYQVKESDGKLWFTFNGQCVCPCEMLNGEPISLLKKMRELYVARNI